MPRHARLKAAGYPLHIVHRGNNRTDCFGLHSHRNLYLSLLDEYAATYGCEVHAYVVMTNHVHLLVTPQAAESASLMMKRVAQIYAQYINRKLGRTGTLWEGRFKSSIVDSETYLLRCYRYIEMNPVRAGMVTIAAEYPWSSHRCNAFGAQSTIVTPHERYLALDAIPERRQREYRLLFDAPIPDEELRRIRDALNGGFALGSEEFISQLKKIAGERVERTRERQSCARVPVNGTGGLSPV